MQFVVMERCQKQSRLRFMCTASGTSGPHQAWPGRRFALGVRKPMLRSPLASRLSQAGAWLSQRLLLL